MVQQVLHGERYTHLPRRSPESFMAGSSESHKPAAALDALSSWDKSARKNVKASRWLSPAPGFLSCLEFGDNWHQRLRSMVE
jgi:hypothetical protein